MNEQVYTALKTLQDSGLVTDRDELNRAWFALTRPFLRAPRTRIYPAAHKRNKRNKRTPPKETTP